MAIYYLRQLVWLIFITIVSSITVIVLIFMRSSNYFWYVFIAIWLGFVFSAGPVIIRYFRSRNEVDKDSRIPPSRTYTTQSNNYQSSNQPEYQGPYTTQYNQSHNHCTHCGASIKPNDSFCDNCGESRG